MLHDAAKTPQASNGARERTRLDPLTAQTMVTVVGGHCSPLEVGANVRHRMVQQHSIRAMRGIQLTERTSTSSCSSSGSGQNHVH